MIVIVDYGAGNLTSVKRAVSYLGYDSIITDDPKKISSANRIIFPGVGAAGAAMDVMQHRGIDKALKKAFASKIPMLGICVGCQIIMDRSEENSAVCLGLIRGETMAFSKQMAEKSISELPSGQIIVGSEKGKTCEDIEARDKPVRYLKVPHMGWNGLHLVKPHPLLSGIKQNDEFYFVHSYFPVPVDDRNIYGETDYGITFASAIGESNLFATQFHLEKSGEPGLLILKNFCLWNP